MPIELKKSPYLFAYAGFLVLVAVFLVWQHMASLREAGAFVVGALAFPALVGAGGKSKSDDDDNHDGGATVPAAGAYRTASPPPSVSPPVVQEDEDIPSVNTPIIGAAVFIGATILLGDAIMACAGATPAEKSAAADATYAGDMLKCVNEAATLAESKACRAKVRATWHVDAGVEGGAQ